MNANIGRIALLAAGAVLLVTASAAASGAPGSRGHPYPRGTAVQLDNHWVVRVVRSVPYAWPLVRSENEFNTPPRRGTTFFMTRLVATYRGRGRDSFDDGSFKAVGRSNVSATTFDPGCGVIPNEMTTRDVFRGGTIRGNICWQVRKTDVPSLKMYYDSWFGSPKFFALR